MKKLRHYHPMYTVKSTSSVAEYAYRFDFDTWS